MLTQRVTHIPIKRGGRHIGRAVAALSSQQRAVVFLTYWMDEPIDVVAEILAVRPGTVRRQLARARHRLRGVLA